MSSLNNPFLIKSYSDEDGNFYRIYSDGWCEQGGFFYQPANAPGTINLLLPYKDVNYRISAIEYNSGGAVLSITSGSKSEEKFALQNKQAASYGFSCDWLCFGYVNLSEVL